MNEFTKEDLEIILDGILWRDAHILPCDRPEKLKSKIQSMIDNYCEHPFEERAEDNLCTKCKRYLI